MDGEGTASPGVLEIRIAQGPADRAAAHQMLGEEHLLGAGREAGRRLCQFVLENRQPVAIPVWCAAAWHLRDRDERIGWDAATRSRRLKLVSATAPLLGPRSHPPPAAAHKLARIVHGMIRSQKPYEEKEAFKLTPQNEARRRKALEKQAAALGLTLQPAAA